MPLKKRLRCAEHGWSDALPEDAPPVCGVCGKEIVSALRYDPDVDEDQVSELIGGGAS